MRFIILALTCVFLTCHCASKATKKLDEKVLFSDKVHYKGDGSHEHNPDYDHEAFLGKDEAHSYDEKSPEQSKEKLGALFPKVDADSDGQITKDEMTKWIHQTQNRYVEEDAATQMKQDDEDEDSYVTWDEFMKKAYGFLDENGVPKADASQDVFYRYEPGVTTKEHYATMLARDERKFNTADTDGDKRLSTEEYTAFLHPEIRDHMKPVIVKETLEDLDQDQDGHVSLDEYILSYWPAEERAKDPKEPDWVEEEKKSFSDNYDKNKDGKLDEDELKEYSFPAQDDHIIQEAEHLITESDTNGDGKISKEEMLEKYETFIGSQATDFGDLLKDREEL